MKLLPLQSSGTMGRSLSVHPHLVIQASPPAVITAAIRLSKRLTRRPSTAPSSLMSVRFKFLIVRRSPRGLTISHTFASWFVSKGPAIGERIAAAVPSLRFFVLPLAASLFLASALHARPSEACFLARSERQEGEHVEVFEEGGAENFPSQMMQNLIIRGQYLNKVSHHVECGGGRHAALLPVLDGATADSAGISKLLGGKSELGADSLDAWGVIHDSPAVGEDDGLAIGTAAVIGGDFHGRCVDGVISKTEIKYASERNKAIDKP